MTFIKAGEQFWNEDKTEGYELTRDVNQFEPLMAEMFKPLGASATPEPFTPLPEWAAKIFWTSGGVAEYRKNHEAERD